MSLKTAEAKAYITAVYRDAGRMAKLPRPSKLFGLDFLRLSD